MGNSTVIRKFAGILLLLFAVAPAVVSSEMQANWTPNDEEGAGPLPLSNQQRQQLLQLEQTIMNSPDPSATLQQAAAANEMDPRELAELLDRNHRDMEAAGDSMAVPRSGGARRQNVLWKALVSLTAVTWQTASKHPRAASVTLTCLLLILYMAIQIPRTGLVVSSGNRSLVTSGPTTMLMPPVQYVQRRLERIEDDRPLSLEGQLDAWKTADKLIRQENRGLEDGSTVHKAKPLKQAVTFQTTIDLKEFTEDDDALEDVHQWSLEHAESILSSKDLTEWAGPKLRLVSSESKETSILIVKKLGDWNRYGLLPLQVTHESETNSGTLHLVLTTQKGAHFDGQIHVSVVSANSDTELKVIVRLLVPKKKKALKRIAIAADVCQGLSQSIASSIRSRTKQSVARYAQSNRYAGAAHKRAKDRRTSRSEKERALEEMAADRRRRWQRSNPNSGAYRPSGDRMRSPTNAVY